MDKYNSNNKYVLNWHEEYLLRNWILTGNNTKNYNQYKNKPEIINFKLITKNPIFTRQMILLALEKGINKHSTIQALSFLTMGGFQSKKTFKNTFPLVIKTLDDLYEFLYITKQFRGFGSSIVNAVQTWIKNKSFNELQEQILLYPKNYGWSFQDVLQTIHPEPRSNIEKFIFKYCSEEEKSEKDYKNLFIFKCYEEIKKAINTTENIQKIKMSNKNFPGNIEKNEEIWKALVKNMEAKEIIKNLNYLSSFIDFTKDNFLYNKIIKSNLNSFYLLSILHIIEKPELKKEIEKALLFKSSYFENKNIEMFIDNDLEFNFINNISCILYPYLISLKNKISTKSFFKDKVNDFSLNDYSVYFNIENTIYNKSYSTLYLKNIIKETKEDTKIILVWAADKKIIFNEKDLEYFKNKKLIIITTKQNTISINNKNIYIIQGISYKTEDLLKLIIEGEL